MADSWRQAVRILRTNGPGFFLRFLGSRVVSTASLWHRLRSLPPSTDLSELISLMVDRPLGPGQSVFAMQHATEIAAFLSYMAALRPRVVMEIGTASGGTLFLLARAATPDALLISLDLPGGSFGGGYRAWRKPLYHSFARENQRIILLRGDSHDLALANRVRAILAGRPIDVLFIDGDHSYEGVKADFENYSPLVRPGGLIAFHDIVPTAQEEVTVSYFWKEISARLPSIEFIERPDQQSYGIGVLTMVNQ
jgi:predicted O-methyltransferase YrrM